MTFSIKHLAITLLASLALAGCMGPAGNPGGQPYADEPGGMIAVKPEPAAAAAYDPNAGSTIEWKRMDRRDPMAR